MDITLFCCEIDGIFYRAIDPDSRAFALSGARLPGRYSSSLQPTLYLSASPEGVEAAMKSHTRGRRADLTLVAAAW